MKARSSFSSVIVIPAFVALVACRCGGNSDDMVGSGAPPYSVPTEPAITSFFEIYHASRYSQALGAAKVLDDAATADPQNGPLSFVRFLAHLWHLNEYGRDQAPDGAVLGAEAMAGLRLSMIAKANNPTDPRVDCFLGIQQVNAGRATMNDDLVAQGYQTLDNAVKAWPQFSLFCQALASDSLPASDPKFNDSVEAMWKTFTVCFDEPVDRNNPDITKYLGRATAVGANRACWNDWIAPHNAEGTYLYTGDLLVKQGNVAAAKIIYHNATLIKEYPQWPYKYLLADRLSADLTAKAKLYADADPKNDPPLAGASDSHGCTYCHAASAEEK